MSRGALAIVLHAHLPFVRHPEHDEFLEEYWFYEAMIESYLPLLDAIRRLQSDRVPFRLAINLSPTLLAMMRDPLLISRFRRRLDNLLDLCEKEIVRRGRAAGEERLARMYRRRLHRLKLLFDRDCRGDIAGEYGELQKEGSVELLACAATHGFLPFLSVTPVAVEAQIALGVSEYRRHFGRDPRGIWLPECAYAPGLDGLLASHGIEYFIVESHGFRNAVPAPRADRRGPLMTETGVAVFQRDDESAKQVWSSMEGYPGDPWYREFYRDIGHTRDLPFIRPYLPAGIRFDTGLKYWRITSSAPRKNLYQPSKAMQRVRVHAEHFIASRQSQIQAGGVVLAPYDAELFGHWWYEGPDWLEAVFRAAAGRVRTVTPSEHLRECPPRGRFSLGFSSWGDRGYGDVWLNPQTDWIYPRLHRMADTMSELAGLESPGHIIVRALNQMARELLLAQSSDWPFLITRGGAPHYAAARIETHCRNFEWLDQAIRRRRVAAAKLEQLEQGSRIFPDLDYRIYRRR